MLHRAIVSSTRHDCEFFVYFDCPTGKHAGGHVEQLVCHAWDVSADDLDICNVESERELLERAAGEVDTGDLRLFESGWSDGAPLYADAAVTLLMPRPGQLARLLAAQCLLPSTVQVVGA